MAGENDAMTAVHILLSSSLAAKDKDPEVVAEEDAVVVVYVLSLAAENKDPEVVAGEDAVAAAHILLSLAAEDQDPGWILRRFCNIKKQRYFTFLSTVRKRNESESAHSFHREKNNGLGISDH